MTEPKQCPECGFEELEVNKDVDGNDVVESGWYCPDCSSTFDEGSTLHWDEIDFPVWIEFESYNDHWELLDKFHWQTGLYDGDHNGTPGLRDMKYTVFTVWFTVDEYGSVEGPYDEKGGELL